MRRRQTCDWCGRSTAAFKRLADGGHECRYESKCTAPRRAASHGRLTRLGCKTVLDTVERHHWNLTKAATELGVNRAAIAPYLEKHAPAELAAARTARKVTHNHRWDKTQLQRAPLLQALRMHRYSMGGAARELDRDRDTVKRALQRLAPDVYARLPELRKAS